MDLEGLKDITSDQIELSTNPFPNNNEWRHAKVVCIHDVSTCNLVIINNDHFERFECSLAQISLAADANPRKARDFFAWLSMGKDAADWRRVGRPLNAETLDRLNANRVIVEAKFEGVDLTERPLVLLRKYMGVQPHSFNWLLVKNRYADRYGHPRLAFCTRKRSFEVRQFFSQPRV